MFCRFGLLADIRPVMALAILKCIPFIDFELKAGALKDIHNLDEIREPQLVTMESASGVEPIPDTFTETNGLFPVIGYVQAGDWRTAFEEPVPEFVSYPGVGADEAEFGLRVRGDSMDKRFPEGSILYCNRYNEEDDKLPIGEYVIVMRQDKASDEVEATCKRLEKHESLPDAYVLQPESSNRNHTPMLLGNTDAEKVWINPVVIGAFIKF